MQDETVVDAKAVEGRLAAIEDTVCRHPLNREVLYRMLAYCAEERALDDLEREAASWPEFETATQNQYRLAEHLVRAGGLDRIERDERGAIVMEQDKEGLDEDAVDDLVRSVAFRTTEAGVRFVEQHRPRARLVELLQLAPERADVYIELLEFVRARPRAYNGAPCWKPSSTASGGACSPACSWTSWSARALWSGKKVGV